MSKTISWHKRLLAYPELLATIFVGITAVMASAVGADWVRWYVSAFALIMALILAWDMIKQIMDGAWGVDLLAITAIVSTVMVGEYWAALIVCLMLSGGESLEDYAAQRARSQLTSLLSSAPTRAHRRRADGNVEDVNVEEIEVGDRVIVRPGEVIPVDGILLSNVAVTGESSLTGEALPVKHLRGENLLSGSVNGADAIEVQARAAAADSQYQQILTLVKRAQESQAPVVRLADKVAVPFTVFAFIIAGLAWWISADPVRLAQVLVVATPCPLLLAAPVAFLAGMNRAAKAGIIVKDSGTLERLARVKTAALDKTGTITEGRPRLVAVEVFEAGTNSTREAVEETAQQGLHRQLLKAAAAVENHSMHPLAAAIVVAATELKIPFEAASQVREHLGSGIVGCVGGLTVRVGTAQWVKVDRLVDLEPGQNAVYIRIGEDITGALILQDRVRQDAAATIRTLRSLGVREILMVTGDTQATAQTVARAVGIERVRHSLLPVDKVEAIRAAEGPVLAIGDGVNDAPVLATADVGVAMGARGCTAASESADVVIMRDDLLRAARSVAIGKRTMRVAMQAIGIGVGLSVILMLIGATGVMPAIMGAFMQELIDVACILWALLAARPSAGEEVFASAEANSQAPHPVGLRRAA